MHNFKVGDKVNHPSFGKGKVKSENSTSWYVLFSVGSRAIYKDSNFLTPFVGSEKAPRQTDVQRLQKRDPEALIQTKIYGPIPYIYCQPSQIVREANRGGFDPKYIKPTSELSHGAKYDVMFNLPVPLELMQRLAVDIADVDIVNNRVCSRDLALWLINEGVMPAMPVV